MKVINAKEKELKEKIEVLQGHLQEHKHDLKHAILITCANNGEINVTNTGANDVEFLGLLEMAKEADFEEE